ncbi:MAG: Lrp/AsnC family transcriptional regulator [archaeon]|nr:Lrp/AsnC family transcriptional regulator [archaeon]
MSFIYDKKDAEILARLRVNSNQSMSALAEDLSIPRTTLQERISRLISFGVIKRFTILQDYSKLGKGVTAFILISFQSSAGTSQKEASRELAQIPDIYEVHIISGDWDILVKARGESIESIGQLVMDKIRNIKGVERTLTCASFLTLKEEL